MSRQRTASNGSYQRYKKGRPTTTFCVIMALIVAAAAVILSLPESNLSWRTVYSDAGLKPEGENGCCIYYLDVGQADCTAFVSDSAAGLIDCGDRSSGSDIADELRAKGIESLAFIIITHAHDDHLGGLLGLLEKMQVDTLFLSDTVGEGEENEDMFDAVFEACDKHSVKLDSLSKGDSLTLGEFSFNVLALDKTDEDVNDRSAVVRVECGDNAFLFTGDASSKVESELIASHAELSCDILKAGHHGSRYSTSADFLRATNPGLIIFSCGLDNSYSHPSESTLERVRRAGVDYFRTDYNGTITVDAKELVVSCEKGEITSPAGRRKAAA